MNDDRPGLDYLVAYYARMGRTPGIYPRIPRRYRINKAAGRGLHVVPPREIDVCLGGSTDVELEKDRKSRPA